MKKLKRYYVESEYALTGNIITDEVEAYSIDEAWDKAGKLKDRIVIDVHELEEDDYNFSSYWTLRGGNNNSININDYNPD